MPLPLSPAAENIIGTANGNVFAIKNFCTGASPTNLFINKLSSRRLMFFFTCFTFVLRNSFMLNCSATASTTSHLSGLPLGGVKVVTDFTPAFNASSWTSSASLRPALSLSGHIINSFSCNGEKSNRFADFLESIPAPPIVHVAV